MLIFTENVPSTSLELSVLVFDGHLICWIHQKSVRRTIPNASCFMQSVFSLMMSSPLEVVQCEAAALLVELSTAPQVLQVKTTNL